MFTKLTKNYTILFQKDVPKTSKSGETVKEYNIKIASQPSAYTSHLNKNVKRTQLPSKTVGKKSQSAKKKVLS